MTPAQAAERIGDALEAACGHWLALPIFTGGFLAGASVNIDVANIAISYITAALLFLTINRDRRSNAALHAKLDDLEASTTEADSGNVRLEERSEAEIEARRKGASE
jgi:low affinity Fe/Cu permease